MSHSINASRRRFFAQTGVGLIAGVGFPSWLQAMQGMGDMPLMTPRRASANFHADVEIDLFAQSSTVAILPDQATRVLRYTAKLVKGPAGSVGEIPGSYLGPILRFQKGQKIRINFHNLLNEPTVTHWHGLHVPAEVDGHPVYAINQGQQFVYEFEMLNRASMNIYHPHPHNATARQFYHGLAGAIIVNDEEEQRLQLPSGEFEIPIVIQDKQFDGSNQLTYANHMRDRMMGFYGDQILINGQANFKLDVASRAYRFRVLNGSTARIYKLAWDDNTPLTVIGTDGGLLETPVNKPYLMLAPAERLDLWVDFSGRKVGSQLVLRSRSFSGALPAMAGRMMGGHHGGGLVMGSDYPLLSVKVTREISDSPKLPSSLSKISRYQLGGTANPKQPVPIAISEGPMRMVLNGKPYAYNDPLPSERIPVNTVQLLEIFHEQSGHGMGNGNDDEHGVGHGMGGGMGMGRGMGRGMGGGMGMGGGGMGMNMSMAHPIHLHGQYFLILSRNQTASSEAYGTVKDGFVDNGWKDTVLVMPGETIKIIKPFEDFKGLFMYHCHNLEHEDMGMMREFLVQ